MPNLLLTTTCNRSCPYCFAVDTMQAGAPRTLSFREIVNLADGCLAAGFENVGLLGGEPTLHPDFASVCLYLVRRGLRVRVFTNGLTSLDRLGDLDGQPRDRLSFTLNVNAPEIETPRNHERQQAFVRRFPRNTDLGVNLYRPDLDLTFLDEFAQQADLHDAWIRVGFAQPIVGEENEYLPAEGYRRLAGPLVALAEAVFDRRLRVSLDCGAPLCAFTDAQLGSLYRRGALLRFGCGVPLDVAPGGQAWACFPLAGRTQVACGGGTDLREMRKAMERANTEARDRGGHGIFPACADCAHRHLGQCAGGCLAHLLA